MSYNSKYKGAEVESLLDKVNDMGEIPTKVSQLDNDSDFVKKKDVDVPDEEDITSVGNKLKFKDRASDDGMGYVILRKDKTLAEQMTKTNTIYEIRYDFDLQGAEITIPEGCVLDFQGGKLSNGVIRGKRTCILSGLCHIFNNIEKKGTFCVESIYPQWFGVVGDGVNDDTEGIQQAVDFAAYITSGFYGEVTGITVKFVAGVYRVTDTVVIKDNAGINIIGDGKTKSILFSSVNRDILKFTGNNVRGFVLNMRLTGTQGHVTGDDSAILVEGSGNQIDVRGCWFNTVGTAVRLNPSSDSNIIDNVFEYVCYPIWISGEGSGYFNISDNTFYNAGPVSAGGGTFNGLFRFENVISCNFSNNRITADAPMSTQTFLFELNNCRKFKIHNNIFHGDVYRCGVFSIEESEFIDVIDNLLPLNYYRSSFSIKRSSIVNVLNNYIDGKPENNTDAILLEDSDYIVISKNRICSQYGYSIKSSMTEGISKFLSITENNFEGGTSVGIYPCIEIHRLINAVIQGNVINGCRENEKDLICDTTTNLIVANNIFKKNIYVDRSTTALIKGNIGDVEYFPLFDELKIDDGGSSENRYSDFNTNNSPVIFKRDRGDGIKSLINSDGTLCSKVLIV